MTGGGKCPICGKPEAEKFKPFCSQRCSMIDRGRWLGEGYRVEISEENEESAALPKDGDEGKGE